MWIIWTILGIGAAAVIFLMCLVFSRFGTSGTENLDYIIVLGAQMHEDGPSNVLRYRLDAAVTYLNENAETLCIVTGGKGTNEVQTEADGMADYLISHGIDSSRIIREEQAINTTQNISLSMKVMKEQYSVDLTSCSVGIVTNNFHMYRSLGIARQQGLNACGITAKSTFIFLPNNVLRECIGIVKDTLFGNMPLFY